MEVGMKTVLVSTGDYEGYGVCSVLVIPEGRDVEVDLKEFADKHKELLIPKGLPNDKYADHWKYVKCRREEIAKELGMPVGSCHDPHSLAAAYLESVGYTRLEFVDANYGTWDLRAWIDRNSENLASSDGDRAMTTDGD